MLNTSFFSSLYSVSDIFEPSKIYIFAVCSDRCPPFGGFFTPANASKTPSFRAIMENFFKLFLIYDFKRHWLTSYKSLSGGGVLPTLRIPIILQEIH